LYTRNIYDLGRVKQIEKYYPGNYGAPGMKRSKKIKRTPEDIKRQNKTNRWKKIQRLIIANFKEGDWHLILKYKPKERPDTFDAAQDNLKKFLSEMRKAYKKAGIPFKYIAVTERGKKGQVLHHHLIIEDIADQRLITTALVKKLWIHGNEFFVDLYEDGEYEKLADYIVKIEGKEESEWATYSRSRNLITPKPKREKIHRKRWQQEPRAPVGWYVVKDTLYNGINPVTGYPYQHYTIKKINGGTG